MSDQGVILVSTHAGQDTSQQVAFVPDIMLITPFDNGTDHEGPHCGDLGLHWRAKNAQTAFLKEMDAVNAERLHQ